MESFNDVLLQLINSPSGPEYDRVKMIYLFIIESAIKQVLPSDTIKVHHALDIAFANWKRKNNGKEITSIEEFEESIVNRLFSLEPGFMAVSPNTKGIIKKTVHDVRMKKVKFWKRYYALYTRAICKELTNSPLEVHIIVREVFKRLFYKNGPIDDPKAFFQRMVVTISQMATAKGYAVMPIEIPAPEPKDGCAPGMPDVIREKTYKRWELLESRRKQTWVQKRERRMQVLQRQREYAKRKQTNRPNKAGYK
jgi:hypothetical protein